VEQLLSKLVRPSLTCINISDMSNVRAQSYEDLANRERELFNIGLQRPDLDLSSVFTEAPTAFDRSPLANLGRFIGVTPRFDTQASIDRINRATQAIKTADELKTAEGEAKARDIVKENDQRALEIYKNSGIDLDKYQGILDLERTGRMEDLPLNILERRLAGREALQQTQEQLAATMPYLSQAAREAAGINLAASERFLRTKQQMPSAVQNIMASKQAQMYAAQKGEADLMTAVAKQAEAAKKFAGSYAGKFVSAA